MAVRRHVLDNELTLAEYARVTPPTKEDSTGQCLVELGVLPDGFAYKYLFLTMDRANFPGIPTPNWTYGALYLYGTQE